MPDIFRIGEKYMVEDGQGGFRTASSSDFLRAKLELPPGMLDQVNERMNDQDLERQARTGQLKTGTAPQAPLNQQGVTNWERFKVKNLVNSPDDASRLLSAVGYKVRRYGGDPWNFSVSKDGEKWRLVDPTGMDLPQDLFDLTSDAVGAFMTTAGMALGAPGGPMGIIGGGAGGSALAEGLRQGAGAAAGIQQEPSPENLMTAIIAGGAVPALGAGKNIIAPWLSRQAGSAASGIKEAALEAGAKLTRTTGTSAFPPEDVFLARIRSPIPAGQSMREAEAIHGEMRQALKTAFGFGKGAAATFPEETMARELENASTATVNLSKSLRPLLEHSQPQAFAEVAPTISDPTLASSSGAILDRIHAALEAGGYDPTKVPIAQARVILRELQKVNGKEGLYKGLPITKNLLGIRGDVAKSLRAEVEGVMDATKKTAANGMIYSDLMAKLDRRMRMRTYWTKAAALNKSDEEGTDTFSRWASSLWGKGRAGRRAMLDNVKDEFGLDLNAQAREAFVSAHFGEAGRAPMAPATPGIGMFGRLTSAVATMTPLNPRFITGAGRSMAMAPGTISGRLASAAQPLMNAAGSIAGSETTTISTREAMLMAAQDMARRFRQPEIP